MSASRVTRNAEAPRISIPGKSRSRFASTSFSSRTNSWRLRSAPRNRDEAGERRRHLDAREGGLLLLLLGELDGERERQVRDERERVRRVEGEGRQDREHDALEVRRQLLAALGLDLLPAENATRPRRASAAGRPGACHREVGVAVHDLADHPQLLRRGEPVGAALGDGGLELLVQARDADHEELVEVRVEDREELHPLEERPARVERLLEHAPVEREPRDLAIEVERVVLEAVVWRRVSADEVGFAHEERIKSGEGTTLDRSGCEEPRSAPQCRKRPGAFCVAPNPLFPGICSGSARPILARGAGGRRSHPPGGCVIVDDCSSALFLHGFDAAPLRASPRASAFRQRVRTALPSAPRNRGRLFEGIRIARRARFEGADR